MNQFIEKAISLFPSQAAFAIAVEVKSPTVSEWKNGDRPVPIEKCVKIEQATDGLVTRRDLRPDDWHLIWPELVDKNAA